ncbi:hypothetical protein OHA40_32725 [Nocardia sp. NBC_00508]|uniref:hypothetical protein n=1 Tax=Nocardia sp. NBC_00508 TaxID=2975992 RepID=UPI002E8189C0|nr:hypothetical protein [Nocardia sp. NBC_00508]WUD66264.1 hypothetical protein OHA40_32725 [Nocardia sp. NBC_00508]
MSVPRRWVSVRIPLSTMPRATAEPDAEPRIDHARVPLRGLAALGALELRDVSAAAPMP